MACNYNILTEWLRKNPLNNNVRYLIQCGLLNPHAVVCARYHIGIFYIEII